MTHPYKLDANVFSGIISHWRWLAKFPMNSRTDAATSYGDHAPSMILKARRFCQLDATGPYRFRAVPRRFTRGKMSEMPSM